MDMVYVIYKNNKIYRTGSKNAIYLDRTRVQEVVISEAKNDAKLKYKSEHGKGKFDLLSIDEQAKLIDEAKKNYTIRIFTDGGASI